MTSTPRIRTGFSSRFPNGSSDLFFGDGPAPVGSRPGINFFGAHDMAGNVREWCWNESPNGRCLRGGAWNDEPYMYARVSQADPFDRSPKNGFRCVSYPDEISALALRPFGDAPRNFYEETPVSDEAFEVFRNLFSYDKKELAPDVETIEESIDWVRQRVTFDAAYGSERIVAYVFLPKHGTPPYQTVLYFPGSPAFTNPQSDLQLDWIDFFLKSGRAVVYPVYKGTYERSDGVDLPTIRPHGTHRYLEYLTMWVKDARRTIDYLESRDDIDAEHIAYYGLSWGGIMGGIIPAVETRLTTAMILAGGIYEAGLPEANPINYVPRIKMPYLLMVGRYDTIFDHEATVKPLFEMIGTPDEHKALKVYETDHIPPKSEYIKETLAWLDRYLGPVDQDKP